jgi:hypothetical protein
MDWSELAEELLLKVLTHLKSTQANVHRWGPTPHNAFRGVCTRWQRVHDSTCRSLVTSFIKLDDAAGPARVRALCDKMRLNSICLTLTTPSNHPSAGVAENALDCLVGLPITDLCASESGAGDKELRAISRFTSLRTLDLSDSGVTNEGLKTLGNGNLPNLTELNLSHDTPVTDAGIWELRELKSLQKLKLMYIYELTLKGERKLASQLPNLRMTPRSRDIGEGHLGDEGSDDEGLFAEMGLPAGDLIGRSNGV